MCDRGHSKMKSHAIFSAARDTRKQSFRSRFCGRGLLPARFKLAASGVALALIAVSVETWAFRSPERPPLPNFDQRTSAATIVAEAAQQQAVDQLKTKVPALQFSRDRFLGTPRFVSASSGFLS